MDPIKFAVLVSWITARSYDNAAMRELVLQDLQVMVNACLPKPAAVMVQDYEGGLNQRAIVLQVATMLNSMALGRKIEAIKAHRSLTGYGLKESKDAVEACMGGYTYEHPFLS